MTTAIMRPSMASEPWMNDTAQVLTEYIRQLEATPAGKRIVLYHTAYGIYAEWHYFGMVKDLPDTSKPMQKAFIAYLKDKYQNDTALQEAWKDSKVTLENAQIPSAQQRLAIKDGDIFVPGSDCRVIDFTDCMAAAVNNCQTHQRSGQPDV